MSIANGYGPNWTTAEGRAVELQRRVVELEQQLAAALAALQRQQWVPVSERLPPEGVDVLVLHDYGQIVGNPAHRDYGKRYGHHITRRYGRCFIADLIQPGQVTHWMPLPEAPQPEEAP